MANQQVREILEEARRFHDRLAALYRETGDRQTRERVRLLLHYLSRHEVHLSESMTAFQKEGAREVLGSWIPSKTVDDVLRQLQGLRLPANATSDEIVRLALQYDDHLVSLFRLLAEKAPDDHVRQLFLSLVTLEQKAESTLARDTIDFSDL